MEGSSLILIYSFTRIISNFCVSCSKTCYLENANYGYSNVCSFGEQVISMETVTGEKLVIWKIRIKCGQNLNDEISQINPF